MRRSIDLSPASDEAAELRSCDLGVSMIDLLSVVVFSSVGEDLESQMLIRESDREGLSQTLPGTGKNKTTLLLKQCRMYCI